MHRPSSISSITDQPRMSVGEIAGNMALIGLALVITYCAIVGAVHTLIGLGVAA